MAKHKADNPHSLLLVTLILITIGCMFSGVGLVVTRSSDSAELIGVALLGTAWVSALGASWLLDRGESHYFLAMTIFFGLVLAFLLAAHGAGLRS